MFYRPRPQNRQIPSNYHNLDIYNFELVTGSRWRISSCQLPCWVLSTLRRYIQSRTNNSRRIVSKSWSRYLSLCMFYQYFNFLCYFCRRIYCSVELLSYSIWSNTKKYPVLIYKYLLQSTDVYNITIGNLKPGTSYIIRFLSKNKMYKTALTNNIMKTQITTLS